MKKQSWGGNVPVSPGNCRVWGGFFGGAWLRLVLLLQGFDEYMNLVLDDAEEIHSKTKSRKQLGRSGRGGSLESRCGTWNVGVGA